MGKIAETAEKKFLEGFSCSQSVFSTFAEAEGIDLETVLKISELRSKIGTENGAD